MFQNDFFFQNTALMAALTGFPNLKNRDSDILDELLQGYDNVSRERIEHHMSEFNCREELERYIHQMSVNNKERHEWE